MVGAAAAWLQLGTAVLFVVLLVRIGYLLASNPIGGLAQELVYVRVSDLRAPGFFLAIGLLLEMAEYVYPFLVEMGWLRFTSDFTLYINAAQALFTLAAIVLLFLFTQRYTHRGLDRRIRDAMETLAYLAGQRRRRMRMRGGTAPREPPTRERR